MRYPRPIEIKKLEAGELSQEYLDKYLCGSWDASKKSRGFGDTVAKITSSVGVRPCGGCKKRQAKLNKLVPYKR
jgi:hypothetical protein